MMIAQVFCQSNRVLQPASGVGRHQVGNQKLLFIEPLIDRGIFLREPIIDLATGFSHIL